jgi:hypothetical protein
MLKPGGILLLDDYGHTSKYRSLAHLSPAIAIDRFFREMEWPQRCFTFRHVGYWVALEYTGGAPPAFTDEEVETLTVLQEKTAEQIAMHEKWVRADMGVEEHSKGRGSNNEQHGVETI